MMYTILQMPASLWHQRQVIFTSESQVFMKDYLPVYCGELPENMTDDMKACEHLFHEFNLNHPANYASRSLSSGDVVLIDDGKERRLYLCCSVGWYQLDEMKFFAS